MYGLIGMVAKNKEDSENDGGNEMKHNVFENDAPETVLTHSDEMAILNFAKQSSCGSFQEALAAYLEDNESLAHSIDEIETLFPEFKDVYPMLQNFAASDNIYICDRSFVSDLVYRSLDHKVGQMSLSQISDLCLNNIKIIFCYNENAFENAMARGEDNITVKEVHKILDDRFYFVETMLKSFTNVRICNYNYKYEDSIDNVLKFIESEE